jgi:hypothetical protein
MDKFLKTAFTDYAFLFLQAELLPNFIFVFKEFGA